MFKDEIKSKEWKAPLLITTEALIIISSVYCDVDYVGSSSWHGEPLAIEDPKHARGAREEPVGRSRISEYSRIRDIQRWDKTFSLQFKELFVTWGGGFLYSPIFKLFFFSYDFLNTFDVNTLLIYLDLLPTGRPTNCRPINPPNLAHCTILWSFAVSIMWFTSNLLNLSLSFTPSHPPPPPFLVATITTVLAA